MRPQTLKLSSAYQGTYFVIDLYQALSLISNYVCPFFEKKKMSFFSVSF